MLLEQIRSRTRRPNKIKGIIADIETQAVTTEITLDDVQKQMSQTLDQNLLYKLAKQYIVKYEATRCS